MPKHGFEPLFCLIIFAEKDNDSRIVGRHETYSNFEKHITQECR